LPITGNLTAFADAVPRERGLLGLDVAKTTLGVAGADPTWAVATPLRTIRRTRFHKDAQELERLVRERSVGGLVIGWPVNMAGSEGPRCQSVRQFALHLEERLPLPMLLWDERWSTLAVERRMIEADLSRRKRAARVDAAAAAYILQGALDALRGLKASVPPAR
jgi:putative holliday junction resolvase